MSISLFSMLELPCKACVIHAQNLQVSDVLLIGSQFLIEKII
jgi:hypothetical protein